MAFSAADLRMVDDHIALGERHVSRHEELIAFLKTRGHPTEMAEDLLEEFCATLEQHRTHRNLMMLENRAEALRARPPRPAAFATRGSQKRD